MIVKQKGSKHGNHFVISTGTETQTNIFNNHTRKKKQQQQNVTEGAGLRRTKEKEINTTSWIYHIWRSLSNWSIKIHV